MKKQTVRTEDGEDFGVMDIFEGDVNEQGDTGKVFLDFQARDVIQYWGNDFWTLLPPSTPNRLGHLLAMEEELDKAYRTRKADIKKGLIELVTPYVTALRLDHTEREKEEYPYFRGESDYMHGDVDDVDVRYEKGIATAYISLRSRGCSCCGDDYATIRAPVELLNAGKDAVDNHFKVLQDERRAKREAQKAADKAARDAHNKELYLKLKQEFE